MYLQPIDVILSPPPDLIVSSLEAEDAYTTGSTLRVLFTVRNIGAGEPFERYWNDELVSEIPFLLDVQPVVNHQSSQKYLNCQILIH